MMFSLSRATWMRLVVWTVIGLAIYFAYGIATPRRRSGKWRVVHA